MLENKFPGYPIKIRYNDLDTYGHVNNAIYLTYLEEGRTAWFEDKIKGEWDWQKHGIIIAKHEINYKFPVLFGDHIRILLWISDIGSKSFEIGFKLIKKTGDKWLICTHGKSTAVCFDYDTKSTTEVPTNWRELFLENSKELDV